MAILEEVLAELVPGARIALPFIESMVEKGLTTTAIEGTLKQAGMSFRRTDFLELVRAVRGVEASRDYLASVRNDLLPDPSRLAAPVTRTLRTFSFKVTLSGRTGETGELAKQSITISSSRNMTKGQAAELARELFLRQQEVYRPEAEPIEPDTLEAQVSTGTFNA